MPWRFPLGEKLDYHEHSRRQESTLRDLVGELAKAPKSSQTHCQSPYASWLPTRLPLCVVGLAVWPQSCKTQSNAYATKTRNSMRNGISDGSQRPI